MKKVVVMLTVLIFLPGNFALATLQINEIMYNLPSGSDAGREWIEVYNNSDEQIDTENIRLFEGATNHKLTLVQGSAKISAHGYGIIVADNAKFKIDWPSYSGIIFDSTFSLSNTGESLALKEITKNTQTILDEYSYTSSLGGAGDGNSLQKINNKWIATPPTPGVENYLFVKPKIIPKINPPTKETVITQSMKSNIQSLVQPIKKELTQETNDKNSRLLFVTTLIILIIIGSGAIYFLRRRNRETNSLNIAQDYEILE